MPAPKDREKALEAALSQIDRQFGKGSVMRLGDEVRAPIEVIPTGSIALDVALGIGGLPRGRVVEIFGPESSGKTTVALHAVASAQRTGDLPQRLGHQPGLQPDVVVAHLALDLGPGHQGRHRVDHDQIHRARAHQRVADLERLLTVVGLTDQ